MLVVNGQKDARSPNLVRSRGAPRRPRTLADRLASSRRLALHLYLFQLSTNIIHCKLCRPDDLNLSPSVHQQRRFFRPRSSFLR